MSEAYRPQSDQIKPPGHQDMITASEQLGDIAWHQQEYDGPLHYEFVGNIIGHTGERADVYFSEKRSVIHGRGVLGIRTGDTAKDFMEAAVRPYYARDYERLITGEGWVATNEDEDEFELQTVHYPMDTALKLAIAKGFIDEAALVRYIGPETRLDGSEHTFRYPVVAEQVATLQGFSSVDDWRECWQIARGLRMQQFIDYPHMQHDELILDAQDVHKILDDYTNPDKKITTW